MLEGKLQPITGTLAARYATIALPFASIPDGAQIAAGLLSKNRAIRKRADKFKKMIDAGGKIDDHYRHYPVQVLGLGDQVLWVALGGEVVVDYSRRLKKELAGKRAVWVTGYANDVMAYIPSARVLKEGGYEADGSMVYYGLPAKWSPAIEDAVVGEAKELAEATATPPRKARVFSFLVHIEGRPPAEQIAVTAKQCNSFDRNVVAAITPQPVRNIFVRHMYSPDGS